MAYSTLTITLLVVGILLVATSAHAIQTHRAHGEGDHPAVTFHGISIAVGLGQALFCLYLLFNNQSICDSNADIVASFKSKLANLRRK